MKLLFKVTRLFLVVLIPILSIFIFLEIEDEKKVLSSFLEKEGKLLISTISAGSIESLLIEDYPLVDSYLTNIANSYSSIVFIEIFKEDKLVSSIKNNKLLNSKYKIFTHDIKIEDDTIAKIKIAISTKYTDSIIKRRTQNFLLMIGVGSLIIFLLLLYIIKNNLIRYIEELKRHTKLIGHGVYNKKLELNTSDEFEDLASSINIMSNNINEAYQKSKKLTYELKEQKLDLIEANKAKDIFLANMSHELKTPLNSINLISSIMKRNKKNRLNDEELKNISVINKCGQELLYLINDVLDISKLETGQVKLNYKILKFENFIENIKSLFKQQIEEKNLLLEYSYDKNIKHIYSDAEKVKQIIKNLLNNAIKFTSSGKIVFKVIDNAQYVNIIIKDEGIGIDEKKLTHIFDRFKQIDDGTSRKYAGTGLGLAICKELSHLLNGDIFVESKINEGSCFTLKIPKNLKQIEENKKNTELEIKNSNIKDNKKILVFSKIISHGMNLVIELKKTFHVTQVFTFKELLNEVKKDFDTVIIDIDNIEEESIKNLIDLPLDIKSKIILTLNDKQDLDSNLKISTKNIFKKPFDNKILINSILN